MKETKCLEYKETITNTFLKTVSAFANYDGGEVVFGIDDNGVVKGIDDVEQACLNIENKIIPIKAPIGTRETIPALIYHNFSTLLSNLLSTIR